jgi:hypothetical protein
MLEHNAIFVITLSDVSFVANPQKSNPSSPVLCMITDGPEMNEAQKSYKFRIHFLI